MTDWIRPETHRFTQSDLRGQKYPTYVKATSHSSRPLCKLLRFAEIHNVVRVAAIGRARNGNALLLRVIYGSLTTFWQSRTNVVATFSDLCAKLIQTPASFCWSAKTVCEYATIGKLSRCECTATVYIRT